MLISLMRKNNIKTTMRNLILFLLFPLIIFGQKEIDLFKFKADYKIESITSFSDNKNHYILSYYKGDSYTKSRQAIHILILDSDYKYVTRKNIKFYSVVLDDIHILSFTKKNANSYTLRFLNKVSNSYLVCEAEFNLNDLAINNVKTIYKVPLPEKFKDKFFKILQNEGTTYFIYLLKKEKAIEVYTLEKDSYNLKTFSIHEKLFNRIKSNIKLLINSNVSNSYLDSPIGHQYHINNNNLYLITARCKTGNISVNGSCVSEDNYFPIQIIKLDLKTGKVRQKEINQSFNKNDFSIANDKLFYTFGFLDKQIHLNYLDLYDLSEKSIILNKDSFNDIEFNYTSYALNSDKIQSEKVDYKKFVNKLSKQPSLIINKVNDSIYNVKIGQIKYKAYKSFGDWLGDFALANIAGNLSLSAGDNLNVSYLSFSKSEIPKIYIAEFSLNINSKKIEKKQLNNVDFERETVLNNLKYFIKKKMISSIESSSNKDNQVYLLSNYNFRKFYIYNFKKLDSKTIDPKTKD